ncbi:MAG: PAS domain S-box protein [Syntrophales bacterium]|nr:PAS domain S-box protein [Syntrophales bacterium]
MSSILTQADSTETGSVPLYSSRITKSYVEYLDLHYPEIDADSALDYSGITRYQLVDQGHWFNQRQVDLFQEAVVKKTGNPDIAREVGRYASTSKAWGIVVRYMLGFITPATAYMMLERLYPHLSRACTVHVKKLKSNRVEVIVTPKPHVEEKPYQCKNRWGSFEGIAKLFTSKLATIEHPVCIHEGGDCCRYIITWEKSPAFRWKRIRSYIIPVGIILYLILFFALPGKYWLISMLSCALFMVSVSLYSEYREKKELVIDLESQGYLASSLLNQTEISYNNALLIKELGQAFSSILDIDKLFKVTMETMQKRLDFDRGMIMLANKERARLVYTAGFGYKPTEEEFLKQAEFRLDNPESKGQFVQAFKGQKSFLVSDIKETEKDLSERSLEFAKRLGALSFICVPIVYEGCSEGILAVDNVQSKRKLTESDMSLLTGISTQIAISINNAKAYEKVRESEERFRALSDNAPDIIYTLGIDGLFTYVNPAWEKILGHRKKEVIGRHLIDFMKEEGSPNFVRLIKNIKDNKETIKDVNVVISNKDGHERLFTMNNAPNLDSEGNVAGIVGTLKDITKLKQSEIELKKSFEKLQMAMNSTINAMSMITESRDPYTSGHQKQVADLAVAIAEEMNLSEESIKIIHMASLIHDIGKIQIPAEILVKPGKLSEIEFSMIKTHSEIGYNILKTVEFTPPIAEIVLQHHERLDGSGYPKGITGNEIILEARIIAVADVVEAMASHRPYRPSRGADKALEEITKARGVFYDADVVDACLKLFKEKGFEFKQDWGM